MAHIVLRIIMGNTFHRATRYSTHKIGQTSFSKLASNPVLLILANVNAVAGHHSP